MLDIRFDVGKDEENRITASRLGFDTRFRILGLMSLFRTHGSHNLAIKTNSYKEWSSFCKLVMAEVVESELDDKGWANKIRESIREKIEAK